MTMTDTTIEAPTAEQVDALFRQYRRHVQAQVSDPLDGQDVPAWVDVDAIVPKAARMEVAEARAHLTVLFPLILDWLSHYAVAFREWVQAEGRADVPDGLMESVKEWTGLADMERLISLLTGLMDLCDIDGPTPEHFLKVFPMVESLGLSTERLEIVAEIAEHPLAGDRWAVDWKPSA